MIRIERNLVEGARAGTAETGGGRADLRKTASCSATYVGQSDVDFAVEGVFHTRPGDLHDLDSPKIVQVWWTGVKYAYRQQNRHHFVLLQSAAERLPCSVDLLARRRFPQFLRGHPQRGFALRGSSLHRAFRRLCRRCVFRRERRPGHRHSSRPRRPLLLQQQHCSDGRCSFRLLIVFRGDDQRGHGARALTRRPLFCGRDNHVACRNQARFQMNA